MARYTYDFRYDAHGVIDYGHYRAKARAARNETRTRMTQRILMKLVRLIGLMLRSAKRVSKHGAAPSFETPR